MRALSGVVVASLVAACQAAPQPPPVAPAPAPAPTPSPGSAAYIIPDNAQEPTIDLPVGTQWSLPCKRTSTSSTTSATPVASLECHVNQAKNIGYAHLAHIACRTSDAAVSDISPVDPSQWVIAMHGGIWSVLDHRGSFWSHQRRAAPDDLVALRREHPMIAAPAREESWLERSPAEPDIGTQYWHVTHDGDWCERQMPTGLGGGEHFFVQCFDRTGQLRGAALAHRESNGIATACGSLVDIPAWIFER